jgi:hypothetical protein
MARKMSERNRQFFIRDRQRQIAAAVASGMDEAWIEHLRASLAALLEG